MRLALRRCSECLVRYLLSHHPLECSTSDDIAVAPFIRTSLNCVSCVSYDSGIWTNQRAGKARDWKIAWCLEKSMEDAKKNFFRLPGTGVGREWRATVLLHPPVLHPNIDRLFTALLAIEIFFLCNSTWHIGRAVRAGLKRCVFELNTFLTCLISSLWKTKKKSMWRPFQATTERECNGGLGERFSNGAFHERASYLEQVNQCL